MVKGKLEEVEEGMLRRKRVNEGICCCSRKVADLKIYLSSATKQDTVHSPETVCLHQQLAVHTVQWNWICALGRYLMP